MPSRWRPRRIVPGIDRVPLAGDDKAALDIANSWVSYAGFEPVVVGGLATAKRFDPRAAGLPYLFRQPSSHHPGHKS